jgi:hypothetical protein
VLPVFLSDQAREYKAFAVGVYELGAVALTEPPPATAWARHLLEQPPDVLSWNGHSVRLTLDNGSWVWVAEGQSPDGHVIYARWPD